MTKRDKQASRRRSRRAVRDGDGSFGERIQDLISDIKEYIYRERYFSLGFEIALTTIVGVIIAVGVYIAAQVGTSYLINTQLASDIKKTEREFLYVSQLQEYADDNGITLETADRLLEVATSRYVQLILYTDLPDGTSSGHQPTREEMTQYAADHAIHVIGLADGAVLALVNDFSEYYYYNFAASVNFLLALMMLIIIIYDRVRRIIKRIKRLESDVAVVSYSDINHRIMVEGKNDISKLASNVETMRLELLDNLRKEKEARDANTELITSLSHDIRTPLTVILGYLEMIGNKTEDEQIRGYISVTEKTALRLKTLSDDMFKYFLAFGNIGDGITLGEYDAHTLLEQMLSEHILLLTESGYKLEIDKSQLDACEGVSVITDADNLVRIFDNIFSNFYKYAEISEPISISLSRIGDVIVIEFSNTVREDTGTAESNKIGLRTCSRLAEFILEGFEYAVSDGKFSTRMVLKTTVSDDNTDTPFDETAYTGII